MEITLSSFIWQGDIDGDGYLDYGEFVAISVHLRKMGNDDHLHKAFQFFDQNKSGYIEIEELRDALADEVDTNGEEVINAIIQDVDTDKVSYTLLFLFYSFFGQDGLDYSHFSSRLHYNYLRMLGSKAIFVHATTKMLFPTMFPHLHWVSDGNTRYSESQLPPTPPMSTHKYIDTTLPIPTYIHSYIYTSYWGTCCVSNKIYLLQLK